MVITILKYVLIGVFILCGFLASIAIINLLITINDYFSVKKSDKLQELQLKYQDKNNPHPTLNAIDRVDFSLEIINLCNVLIDNEVGKLLESYRRLNMRYDAKKLDKDVERITKKVFDGVQHQVIIDPNHVITPEYILQHISDQTMLRVIQFTQEYNNSIL